jgi:hypothetical protein
MGIHRGFMKTNQLIADSICIKCLGCNKLEMTFFKGLKECQYFVSANKDKLNEFRQIKFLEKEV